MLYHGLGHWDKVAADERLGLAEKLACVVNPGSAPPAAAAHNNSNNNNSNSAAAPGEGPDGQGLSRAGSMGPPGAAVGDAPEGSKQEEEKAEKGEKGNSLPKGE